MCFEFVSYFELRALCFIILSVLHNIKKLLTRRFDLPFAVSLENLRKKFSPAEKAAFFLLSALLVFAAGNLARHANALFLIEVPARGGTLTEGIVGSPRFVNPLLAFSDADRDLSALLYSGLLRATSEGELIPDLAKEFSVSENGLVYSFTLREDAVFHDGAPLTADDVLFTIQKAQDPGIKSPKRANWEGVTAEKADERTVTLTLKQPYAPFLENATLGILPKRLWTEANTEQFPFSPRMLDAVGSGPYRIERIKRNSSGIPVAYELAPFRLYALGVPFISRLVFRFYQNETEMLAALRRGDIESANTIAPEAAEELRAGGRRVEETPLPRVFGVFFNQNQAQLLAERPVRQALSLATDKQSLVKEILHGYGVSIDSPVPPLLFGEENKNPDEEGEGRDERLSRADALLKNAKWTINESTGIREKKKGKETQMLSFSLATANAPELLKSAEELKKMWEEIGVAVDVKIFETGDLNQNVIRPRKYDALLFGEIIGRDLDLFAFWHSSQRNDPGLNIALYTNSKVDKLLEEGRRIAEPTERMEAYKKASEAITADIPAIFLYAPDFIYVLPEKIKGLQLERLTIPSERFLHIHEWYTETEKIWRFLVPADIS